MLPSPFQLSSRSDAGILDRISVILIRAWGRGLGFLFAADKSVWASITKLREDPRPRIYYWTACNRIWQPL
jgi:hypothetical protein